MVNLTNWNTIHVHCQDVKQYALRISKNHRGRLTNAYFSQHYRVWMWLETWTVHQEHVAKNAYFRDKMLDDPVERTRNWFGCLLPCEWLSNYAIDELRVRDQSSFIRILCWRRWKFCASMRETDGFGLSRQPLPNILKVSASMHLLFDVIQVSVVTPSWILQITNLRRIASALWRAYGGIEDWNGNKVWPSRSISQRGNSLRTKDFVGGSVQ